MKFLLPFTAALLIALIAIVSNRSHPFEDPQELRSALVMGWVLRGVAEHDGIDAKGFIAACIESADYDKCREAEQAMVVAVRVKHHLGAYPGIPQAQSSAPVVQERP